MCRTAEIQPSSAIACEQARNRQYSKEDFEYKLKMWQLRNSPFGDANRQHLIKDQHLQRPSCCTSNRGSAPRIVAMISKARPVPAQSSAPTTSCFLTTKVMSAAKRKSVMEKVSPRKIGSAVKKLIKFFECKI